MKTSPMSCSLVVSPDTMDGTSDQVQTLDGVVATRGRDHASTHNGRRCGTGHRAGSGRTSRYPGDRSGASWQVVAPGLDSPRGLTFGPNGTLYVAEAGGRNHPVFPHPLGESAHDHRCRHRGRARTADAHLYRAAVLRIAGTPEVFGPSDVASAGTGKLYVTLGLGADPVHRAVLPEEGQLAATVIRAKPSQGTFGLVADIGAFELSDNPDGGLPDSNPQGLLSTPLGQVIADAGGNRCWAPHQAISRHWPCFRTGWCQTRSVGRTSRCRPCRRR